MEDFKKRFDYENENNYEKKDFYLEELNKQSNIKKELGIMNKKLDVYYHENLSEHERKKKFAIKRFKNATLTWAAIFILVTNSFAIYPLSCKIVRKVFKLKGFWNIHMGIVPIIINWNAIVMGILHGVYLSYNFENTTNK